MGGVSYFCLWLHSYSKKFNSDSSPIPSKSTKIELRLHSESDKKRHTPTLIRLRVLTISGSDNNYTVYNKPIATSVSTEDVARVKLIIQAIFKTSHWITPK